MRIRHHLRSNVVGPRSIPFVNMGADTDDQVAVDFTDPVTGGTVDTSFLITAFC